MTETSSENSPLPGRANLALGIQIDAILFDLDGVITQTARLHALAWKHLFDDFLKTRAAGQSYEPFDITSDYRRFVDGKPRMDGLRGFLQARHITVPQGHPDDSPDQDTLFGLAERKNLYFLEALDQHGVDIFPSALEFLKRARAGGIKTALISASRNARRIIEHAALTDYFDTIVDGETAAEVGLRGKPLPDTFLEATRRLGVAPACAAVIEDAVSGVTAGKDGGFGLVIGVDRTGYPERLVERGAGIVINDLNELLPGGGPPQALTAMNTIATAIKGRKIAVFLDYDGTLSPIVSRPEDAVLPPETRAALEALGEVATLAFVSGRKKDEVKAFVGLDTAYYAGSHGFEIEGPDGLSFIQPDGAKVSPVITAAATELQTELGSIPGILIEDKSFAIAVHFRNVSKAEVAKIEQTVDRVLQQYTDLHKSGGKMVIELRPNIDWHKGRSIAYLQSVLRLDGPDTLSFYLGDDVTDEDAFSTLAGRGIGVLVSEAARESYAAFRVANPAAVRDFLVQLTDLIREDRRRELWAIVHERYDPQEQMLREALMALGNGVFVTRAAFTEAVADGTHYPGTYIAGCYNRLVTDRDGAAIENEDLVNAPNWLDFKIRVSGEDWITLESATILSFRQELDLRSGILIRDVRLQDSKARTTRITERRIVHLREPHLAALEFAILPENWSGQLEVRTALDGTVENLGVARYRSLRTKHLEPVDEKPVGDDGMLLVTRTSQSRIEIAVAARTQVFEDGVASQFPRNTITEPGHIAQYIQVPMTEGALMRVEKTVALFTSRDRAISEPAITALETLSGAGRFANLLQSHGHAWSELWGWFDMEVEIEDPALDGQAQRILRLHIFQILQTLGPNIIDLDVGAPARGLHGEAYRGHIFWDELFIFPILTMRMPEITRALLRYRQRRLPQAKRLAQEAGYDGAMYPWQSGSDGREESQKIHLNPKSGRWVPDNSQLQRHVNIAIAYNLWNYYQTTHDVDFMRAYGADMFIELARFWASVAQFNNQGQYYEIRQVMGPDEYHDGYPDTDSPGLNNNAYTNIMAVWTLMKAGDLLDQFPVDDRSVLQTRLGLTADERSRWDDMTRRMMIPMLETGILAQFEGYDELEEFDWQGYYSKYGDIQRLDRILEAEGLSPNDYKVSKQADVLMLFYLLSADELSNLFKRLGLKWSPDIIRRTIDYYHERTSHGSTLSRLVHSWVLARADRVHSWKFFTETLLSDVTDIQGGTTREGIHLGAMAGSVDLVLRCYGGIELREDTLRINPVLPEQLKSLRFTVRYRGHVIALEITHETILVRVLQSPDTRQVRFMIRDQRHDEISTTPMFFDAETGRRIAEQ